MCNRRTVTSLIAIAASIAVWVGLGSERTAASPSSAVGNYIVVFRSSVGDVDQKTNDLGAGTGFTARLRYRHALRGFAAPLTPQQAANIAADPGVASVSPDRPIQASAAALAAGESVPPTGVRRIAAASTNTVHQASSVKVAVLDTGIDLTHPDLNASSGTNCVGSGPAQDDNGHGTHVAGTIAAKNNGSGIVGVAPGTALYAVKVLNSTGGGAESGVICGLDWVSANARALNIRVANLSLGGPGANDGNCGISNADPLHRAICASTRVGVTDVVAAGNGDSTGRGIDFATRTPAAYPEALTVTAIADGDGRPGGSVTPSCASGESDDHSASFSNFATQPTEISHTIAAPGLCIVSTYPGGTYVTESGTSMAAPHVSGAVALCLGEGGSPGPCSGLTTTQIIGRVRQDAATHSASYPGYGFCGDPNHSSSPAYFGNLVFAPAVATVAPGPLTCSVPPAPAPPSPPPPPTVSSPLLPVISTPVEQPVPSAVTLTLRLSGAPRQRAARGPLRLYAVCNSSCRLASRASVAVARRRAMITLAPARGALMAAMRARLSVKFPRPIAAAITRLLRKRKSVVATVRAAASGGGHVSAAALRIVLIR